MKILSFLSCLCFLLTASCGTKGQSISIYLAPDFKNYYVSRVAVLPFYYQGELENSNVTSLFCDALQYQQKFEVIRVSSQQIQQTNLPKPRLDHLVPAEKIVKIAKIFQVQGIVRGRITTYQLLPMRLGLKIDLISASDGRVLWSADGIFTDEEFYSSRPGQGNTIANLSPQRFIANSCQELTKSLNNKISLDILQQ